MTLINLDSVQFYEPPSNANLAGVSASRMSKSDVPTVYGGSVTPKTPGSRPQTYDLVEYVDLTGLEEPLDVSCEPAPLLKGNEVHLGGPSNGLHSTGDLGRDGDDDLPSLEELLFGFSKAQGSQQPGSNKLPAKHECNGAPHPESTEDENKSEDDSNGRRTYISDSSTSTKEGEKRDSHSTPSTSVVGSEVGYNSKSSSR